MTFEPMTFEPTLALVAAAIFFAGFVKGATGMGFPLIATPMLTLLLDIRMAIVVLLLPSVVMDLGLMFRRGIPTAILRRFSSMFLFALAGVFLGTWELTQLPLWVLNLILGTVVILFSGAGLFAFTLDTPARAERLMSPVMGFVGGFFLGLTNTMGPVMALYLHGLRLDKADFVKAISTAMIMAKFWQVIAVSTWGLFTAGGGEALAVRHRVHPGELLPGPQGAGPRPPADLQPGGRRAADLHRAHAGLPRPERAVARPFRAVSVSYRRAI